MIRLCCIYFALSLFPEGQVSILKSFKAFVQAHLSYQLSFHNWPSLACFNAIASDHTETLR
jgi:hypothetical protein